MLFVFERGLGMFFVLTVWVQDYSAENPNIGLLRLRNYTVGRKLKDEEVLGHGGLDRIVNLIGILTPFVGFRFLHASRVVYAD